MAAIGAEVVSNPAAKKTTGRRGSAARCARLPTARRGPYVAAGRARLLQRAGVAFRHVHRHAQHVAEADQRDRCSSAIWMASEDRFLGQTQTGHPGPGINSIC